MNEKRSYKALWILVLVVIVGFGIFFFFYRMYQNDMRALEDFVAAYQKYDQAISDLSNTVLTTNRQATAASDDLEQKADEALGELNSKASARISSLIRNESQAMSAMLEIASLAGNELDAVKGFKNAVSDKNSDLTQLAQKVRDLTDQRHAAFAQFLALGGQ